MKTSLRLLVALFVIFFTLARFAAAGDFVSTVIQGSPTTPQMLQITVPADRFLVIRNFTQEGPATTRGFVSVTDSTGFMAKEVLTATILDPSNTTSLEPINDVVVGGPATVTVTGGDTNCLITYRKGEN
jgi:hypothetical protein